jgi:hypothetical protein
MGVGAIGSCCCLLLCLKNPTRWRGRKWWKTRQDDDCIRRLERNWCVKLTNEKTDYNAQYIRLETHPWVGSRLNSIGIYATAVYIIFAAVYFVYRLQTLLYDNCIRGCGKGSAYLFESVGAVYRYMCHWQPSLFLLLMLIKQQHA